MATCDFLASDLWSGPTRKAAMQHAEQAGEKELTCEAMTWRILLQTLSLVSVVYGAPGSGGGVQE